MREKDEPDAPALTIEARRSGGIAGLTRRWRVEASDADADAWRALVERCPWDDAAGGGDGPRGADRFAWTIECHDGDAVRRAHVGDGDDGWTTLLAAVRRGSTTETE